MYPIEQEKWMENYTRLHSEVRCRYPPSLLLFLELLFGQIMRGERKPKFIEYTCPEWAACGGLADRMMGMITTFAYGVLTDRAVLITWEQPLPLDMLFDSAFIDWSSRFLPAPSPSRHPIYDNKTLLDNLIPFDGHVSMAPQLMTLMTQLLEERTYMANPYMRVRAPLSPGFPRRS